ncbi:MAG: hypothetical protein JST54_03020 [Deltaproteobacteria bacterium]|nr:hypothetical protein [Deltaproteobacteria bacterium]
MGRSDREGGELPRVYEGAEALEALLAMAGEELDAATIKDIFQEAQKEGDQPSDVFPALFAQEPRFPSPDLARRLYGNLFGLWDRVARGQLDEPKGRPAAPEVPEPIAPPPAIEGATIPDEFVQAALGALTTLPEKERGRQRDRFEQRESELCESLRQLKLSDGAEQAGLDLSFELWLLCGWALGERAGRTAFKALRDPPQEGSQPALERFIAEWLGEAELDEDDPLKPEERQKLEPFLRRAAELLAPPEKAPAPG